VYDHRQHLDLFSGPGKYLFRGTLPNAAFAAPYVGPGVTPPSVDPIVATLFAGPNLASFQYELAVNIELAPHDFEQRCCQRIGVDSSLDILRNLGYLLPSRLPDLGALTLAVLNSPRMPLDDIERYVGFCQQIPNE
jgi:hypothetical protein